MKFELFQGEDRLIEVNVLDEEGDPLDLYFGLKHLTWQRRLRLMINWSSLQVRWLHRLMQFN